jgi:hypothetical protein
MGYGENRQRCLQWITSSQVSIYYLLSIWGCRSQTKMAVGEFPSLLERIRLRYSRADYLRKLVRFEFKITN